MVTITLDKEKGSDWINGVQSIAGEIKFFGFP